MGCLPYVKFYTGDWMADATVRHLSPEARGLYIDLLAIAWDRGGIPLDPSQYAKWLNFTPARFRKAWAEIEHLWVHGGEGELVNPRQEEERAKALEAHERRVRAGRKGGRA